MRSTRQLRALASPSKPVKRRNEKRQAVEMPRKYGPPERRELVKSLPCAACGVVGYSQNAHVCGNGGAGRKGDCTTIAPLCGATGDYIGCHLLFDRYRFRFDEWYPDFDPITEAAKCEAAWQSYLNRNYP